MKNYILKTLLVAAMCVFAFVAKAEDESTGITAVIDFSLNKNDKIGSFESTGTELGKGVTLTHVNLDKIENKVMQKYGTEEFARLFGINSQFKLSVEDGNPYEIVAVEIKGYEYTKYSNQTLTTDDNKDFTLLDRSSNSYIFMFVNLAGKQGTFYEVDYKVEVDNLQELNFSYFAKDPNNLPGFGFLISQIIVTLREPDTVLVENYDDWGSAKNGKKIIFNNSLKVVAQDADKKWLMISDPESDKAIVAKFDTPITETFYPGEMLAPGLSGIKSADGTLMVDSERVSSFKSTRLEPAPMSLSELTAENIGDYVYVTNYVLPNVTKSLNSNTNIAFNNALNIDIPASHNVIDFYGLIGGTETELNIMPVQILRSIYTAAENVVASTVSIMTQPGMIIVNGECDQVQVYDTNGRVISKGEKQIPCSSGIYVVKADNQAQVVQVK